MLRTVLALLTIVAIACGNSGTTANPEGTGPVFSPLIANGLRAIAPDCQLDRAGATERRDCTGRHGTVQIKLASNKLTSLVVALPSRILPEAKGHIDNALKAVLGQAGVDQVIQKMAALETGQRTDLTIGNAKILVIAGGTSKIAPEYSVELTWL